MLETYCMLVLSMFYACLKHGSTACYCCAHATMIVKVHVIMTVRFL